MLRGTDIACSVESDPWRAAIRVIDAHRPRDASSARAGNSDDILATQRVSARLFRQQTTAQTRFAKNVMLASCAVYVIPNGSALHQGCATVRMHDVSGGTRVRGSDLNRVFVLFIQSYTPLQQTLMRVGLVQRHSRAANAFGAPLRRFMPPAPSSWQIRFVC
jgi:hypothetical protein